MNFEIKLFLDEKDVERSVFLTKMCHLLVESITLKHSELITIIVEILKNVHDHASGQAEVFIKRTNSYIEFKIKDEVKNFDVDIKKFSQQGFSTKSGNKVNYGAGLGLILHPEIKKRFNLKLDTSHGFKYSGKYYL